MARPHGDLKRFRATLLAPDSAIDGAVLVRNGRVAARLWPRLKGLLGTRELLPGDGLLITPCNSVHMIGMRYAIDVLYLDAEERIVGMDERLPPGRIGGLYRGARYVIELPAGTCGELGVEVGHQVAIGPVVPAALPSQAVGTGVD